MARPDADRALPAQARYVFLLQRHAGNRAVAGAVQRFRDEDAAGLGAAETTPGATAHANDTGMPDELKAGVETLSGVSVQERPRLAIQRAKGDKHSGTYVRRGSDGTYWIRVWINDRPTWFAPPQGHKLELDQNVTFVEGDANAVTELVAEKTYTLFDGTTKITDADILGGTVRPIEDRRSGDVELVIATRPEIRIHVHPYVGSGSTPTGGGVSIGGRVSRDNAPQDIVEKITTHAQFEAAVKAAAPKSREGAWRK